MLVLPAGLVSEVCRGDGCWSYLQAWSVRSVEVMVLILPAGLVSEVCRSDGAGLTCRPGQ